MTTNIGISAVWTMATIVWSLVYFKLFVKRGNENENTILEKKT